MNLYKLYRNKARMKNTQEDISFCGNMVGKKRHGDYSASIGYVHASGAGRS